MRVDCGSKSGFPVDLLDADTIANGSLFIPFCPRSGANPENDATRATSPGRWGIWRSGQT